MWQETSDGLYQKFVFENFKQAFEFMTKVAEIAEAQQHHPRWTNEWNSVEIWLSTHDAEGKITEKDKALAKGIDEISKS